MFESLDGAPAAESCSDKHQRIILQYLKDHGDLLDTEIATEMGRPLEEVCQCLSDLSRKGDVIMCRTTRYVSGHVIEGMLCRASGYSPQARPGRKPNARGNPQ